MNLKQSGNAIKNNLLQNRNLSMILYVLSETPSYIDELAVRLNIPKSETEKAINYLKIRKLIQELKVSNCSSRDFYPTILKKLKDITSGLSPNQSKDALRNVKFYFISRRGRNFLHYARKCVFENKRGDRK